MRVFTHFPYVVLVVNFEFAGFRKEYTAYDCFHGNGLYGEIPTKEEPIRTLGFTSRPSNANIINCFYCLSILLIIQAAIFLY